MPKSNGWTQKSRKGEEEEENDECLWLKGNNPRRLEKKKTKQTCQRADWVEKKRTSKLCKVREAHTVSEKGKEKKQQKNVDNTIHVKNLWNLNRKVHRENLELENNFWC